MCIRDRGSSFDHYDKYFSLNTDSEAVTYLQLANELIKEVNPEALSLAEDTSAMPGLCLPIEDGGLGFDYRLAMGEPDLWVRTLKEVPDEDWDIWNIWYELPGRRPEEPVIGYVAVSYTHLDFQRGENCGSGKRGSGL